MCYSTIISKLLNLSVIPSFLIKLNLWSFINIKFFFFKSNSAIFFFITNLSKLNIRFIRINNYSIVYTYIIFYILIIIFIYCFL